MTRRLKNSIKACAAVLSVLTFCGCSWGEYYWTDSYIQEYKEINGFHFWQVVPGSFRFIGSGRSASIKSIGEDKAWFDKICHENGDFTYSRKVRLLYGMTDVRAYTPDIVSIDVYCEDDFDSAHPAGSSLNDCITFEYNSAKSFIESGYPNADAVYMMPIQEKLLSELAPEDLKIMLDDFCYLDFKVKPEELITHSMRIVMKMSDGKEYSDSFRYNFSTMKLSKPK